MVSLSTSAREQVHTLLSEAVESKRTPGLVFGATSAKEEISFTHAGPRVFGDPAGGSMADDSIFWICSQTKMITSIAALQLVEQGKVQLDSPVFTILPELADPVVLESPGTGGLGFKPAESNITLRQLLNHSSGLIYDQPQEGEPLDGLPFPLVSKYDEHDPSSRFNNLVKGSYPGVPLKFQPGASFAYGYGLDFVGFLIERLSGECLEQYFKKHIFSPLGITSASFYLTPDLKDRAVQLSFRDLGGKIVSWADQYTIVEQDPSKVHLQIGGAGVYSSLKDYLTLLRHLLQVQAGSANSPILKAEFVRLLFEPSLTTAGASVLMEQFGGTDAQFGCGLCVNTTDRPGKRRKGSGWWSGWANTYHLLDPETGIALVFGSQLVPPRDAEMSKLWDELEGIIYSGLQITGSS